MTDYAHGTPCWVDLACRDVEDSVRFYSGLFGWTADAPGAHGYRILRDGGRTVAGMIAQGNPGQPLAWTTWVLVDDADAAAARVTEHGGAIFLEPTDFEQVGRLVIAADPQGGYFTLWRPGGLAGAEKVNAPSSLCWNGLDTPDVAGAAGFYAALFGWQPREITVGGAPVTVFTVAERPVAGASAAAVESASWRAWFSVEDCDAAVARAVDLGGSVETAAHDIPGLGRSAVLVDHQGSRLTVLRGDSPDE